MAIPWHCEHIYKILLPPLYTLFMMEAPLIGGSFKRIIASATQIFWEGSRRTYGCNPGSFHTESYGMLAALQFLLQYLLYFQVTLAAPLTEHLEFTNSKSLIH
jgi:hypothetical protein